jgi:PTS system ascorbate-specific IIB component
MKIITVCGMGVGTSVLLKMNTDTVLERMGVAGEAEAADLGIARGAALGADLVLMSREVAEQFDDLAIPVRVIRDFMDLDEIAAVLSEIVGAQDASGTRAGHGVGRPGAPPHGDQRPGRRAVTTSRRVVEAPGGPARVRVGPRVWVRSAIWATCHRDFFCSNVNITSTQRRRPAAGHQPGPPERGRMKIVAVCGTGTGSSVLLKMSTDAALERLGLAGEVEAADVRAAHEEARGADLLLTDPEKAAQLDRPPTPVRAIQDFTDADEITAVVASVLRRAQGGRARIALVGPDAERPHQHPRTTPELAEEA